MHDVTAAIQMKAAAVSDPISMTEEEMYIL